MCTEALLVGLERRAIVIADKGYDAERVRAHIRAQGAIPNIPDKTNRKKKFRWATASIANATESNASLTS